MSEREEWGPWIEHDGKGMPVPPWTIVETVDRSGAAIVSRADDEMNVDPFSGSSWEWAQGYDYLGCEIIRYRIRKPRALIQLRDMIENLPAPSRQKEDA